MCTAEDNVLEMVEGSERRLVKVLDFLPELPDQCENAMVAARMCHGALAVMTKPLIAVGHLINPPIEIERGVDGVVGNEETEVGAQVGSHLGTQRSYSEGGDIFGHTQN